MNIIQRPTAAHSTRGVHRPLLFVLHGTAGTAESTYNTFMNPANKASATIVATREGENWQMVPINRTPWTNGNTNSPTSNLVLSMPAGMDINLITLSIEIEEYPGAGGQGDITEPQFWAVIYALKWMQVENKKLYGYTIPLYPDRIQPHSAIDSKGKPACPGPLFPWDRLYSVCASINGMDLDHVEEYITSQQGNEAQRAYVVSARVYELKTRLTDPKWGESAKQKLGYLTGVVEGVDTPDLVAAKVKAQYAAADYAGVLRYEKIMKDKALLP